MQTNTTRDKLLAAGGQIIHARGYAGCGLRAITAAAGLPASSFSSHFASKEAFGLEIMERYYARHYQLMRRTLRNEALAGPLRLRSYFDALLPAGDSPGDRDAVRHGCLLGRLCAEGHGPSELMRNRVADMLLQIQRSIAYCLSAVRAEGLLAPHSEIDELAAFTVASLQGAILSSRTARDPAPLRLCQRQLLRMLGCAALDSLYAGAASNGI
jgi:TetR/AcrR family transcriptional repressor of nem operon